MAAAHIIRTKAIGLIPIVIRLNYEQDETPDINQETVEKLKGLKRGSNLPLPSRMCTSGLPQLRTFVTVRLSCRGEAQQPRGQLEPVVMRLT